MQAKSARLPSWEREPQRPEGPGGLEAVLLVHPSGGGLPSAVPVSLQGRLELLRGPSWGVVPASLWFVHLWAICWASLSGGGK